MWFTRRRSRRTADDPSAAVPRAPSAEAVAVLERARVHARERRFTEAADLLAEARATWPEDVKLLVEDARLSLKLYRRSEEDERHTWKARLLVAEADLHAARSAGRATKGALTTLGDISLALRRWPVAVELWTEIAARYADRRTLATVRLAEAHRQAGDLDAADAALATLDAEARDEPEVRAELQRLAQQLGRRIGDQIVAHAHLRIELGEPAVLTQAVPTAMRTRGHPPERIDRLRPLIAELSDAVDAWTSATAGDATAGDAPPTTDPPPPAEPAATSPARTVLHICGFLYSGSGAVFDHLREREDVHEPFGTREVGFLKKAHDLGTLVPPTGPRVPGPAQVAAAVLASAFGFGQTGRPILGYFSGSDEDLDRFARTTTELVRTLRTAWRTDDEAAVAPAIRRYIDATIAALTPPGHHAIVNNAVIGHQLDRLHLFADARAVAVLRDPRDQFVSQRLESPYPMDLEPFVAMMEERLAALAATLADPVLGSLVVPVRFEDYVQDDGIRRRVAERLRLPDGVGSATGTHFRPEISQRNIGIHRDHPDRDAIALIERTLVPALDELSSAW